MSKVKQYYIYLNGEQYMEIPKDYNIKRNVYLWLDRGITGQYGIAYIEEEGREKGQR